YLARDGSTLIVLLVRNGIVEEIGVADPSLAADAALTKRLAAIRTQTTKVSGPLQALNRYWAAISAHQFASAYGFVAHGTARGRSGFVKSEQREGVSSAQFHGRVTKASATSARIQIVSLVTHDREFGCRSWTGTYTLIHHAGKWMISRADIRARRC